MPIDLPVQEFEFTFARSSGAGGQNVNKVNSKAVLRWSIATTEGLPEDIKNRFLAKFASRVTTDGELIITSQKYRDQYRNVEDCLEKLKKMLEAVETPPTVRKPTKPSKGMREARLKEKKEVATKKQSRQRPELTEQ